MKKTATLLSLVLALSLTACTGPSGREGHGGHQAPAGHEGHGGHAGHSGRAQAPMVHADWSFSPKPEAGKQTEITVRVTDHGGKAVQDFEVVHEKKMHLIIVRDDLSTFDHLHPEYKGGGVFKTSFIFPKSGRFKLIADFAPKGSEQVTQTHRVEVAGPAAPKQPVQPESHLVKTAAGKQVALKFDGEPQAGKETTLTFTLNDAKSGKPVTDLQPYLGAIGHVVILSEDTEQYLHVHPLDEKAAGPEARFRTTFPHPGIYKIWAQFRHQGKVLTVPYVIQVS
jgi:hypothetical protein